MTADRLSLLRNALLVTALAAAGCGGEIDEATPIATSQGALVRIGYPLGVHGGSAGAKSYNIQPLDTETVQEFRIWSGSYVDAIQIVYQAGFGSGSYRVSPKAGGNGGTFNSMIFPTQRYILAVSGRAGQYIDKLCLLGDDSSGLCGGGGGGNPWGRDSAPFPSQIEGVNGRSGSYIDSLTFWYY